LAVAPTPYRSLAAIETTVGLCRPVPAAFSVADEKLEKAADEETSILLQRFSGNPGVEKAKAEFGKAQEVEERFLHDFDGIDFTMR